MLQTLGMFAFVLFFIALAGCLLWAIKAAVVFEFRNTATSSEEKPETVKCPFVVGRLYYINHEDDGSIEAVYMGLTMDGFRHFVNCETGSGMKYKRSDPNMLLKDKDVRIIKVQPEIRRDISI
jgi:hypothetical protein